MQKKGGGYDQKKNSLRLTRINGRKSTWGSGNSPYGVANSAGTCTKRYLFMGTGGGGTKKKGEAWGLSNLRPKKPKNEKESGGGVSMGGVKH